EDLFGSMDIVVFPNIYARHTSLLDLETTILIRGKISFNEEQSASILCENIVELDTLKKYKEKKDTSLEISVDEFNNNTLYRLKPVLSKYKGSVPVIISVKKTKKKYKSNEGLWIHLSESLIDELKMIFGNSNVH